MEKEFFKQLDLISNKQHKTLNSLLRDLDFEIRTITMDVNLDIETKIKFGLNSDISFSLKMDGNNKMNYYFKNAEVEPLCYYLRPDDYHEVDTLTILQECIKQDTHKPDIMYLERGEKSNS